MLGVLTMPKIKARSDFARIVARAGLTRLQLAMAAGVSVRTVDGLANPGGAGRRGFARELTAWRVARGFAELTHQTDEQAFDILFESVDTDPLPTPES